MDGIILASSGNHFYGMSTKRATGAHRIASFLRQQGYTIDVLDYCTYFTEEELYQYLLANVTSKTKFIGFSGTFFIGFPHVVSVSKRIKKKYKHLVLVTGSQTFEHTADIEADYHVVGYGEKAILAIMRGESIKSHPIVHHADRGQVEGKGSRAVTRNVIYAMHDYPAFPMSDLSINHVERDFIQPNETVTLECARGCIFRCKFCSYPILGVKDDHTIDPQLFRDNLVRNYENWGTTYYNLADETFNDFTTKIIKYADVVESLPFEVNFGGYLRADLLCNAKRTDFEHLARMRFNSHFYGIESFNYESAKAIGKGGDPEKMKDRLLEIQDYFKENNGFYHGHFSIIVGLPHETRETFADSMDWCKKNWQGNGVNIQPLFIYHPTKMESSSILSKDYKKYGYTETTIDEIWKDNHVANPDADPFFIEYANEWRQKPVIDYGVTWETPHMNMYDAHMMVADWHETDKFLYGESPFHFGEWTAVGYKWEDLNKSYRDLGGLVPLKSKVQEFFENYKAKKLA